MDNAAEEAISSRKRLVFPGNLWMCVICLAVNRILSLLRH